MRRLIKIIGFVFVAAVVTGTGAVWWLISYIAPDKPLDLNYRPIDVQQKALDMVIKLKPELVLTESDVNDLIKKHIKRDIAEHVRLDGAEFQLEGATLIANVNATYRARIPVQAQAKYQLEWQNPNLVLQPQDLSVKGIHLPLSMLKTITIPLDLPTGAWVTVEEVFFESKRVKVLFRIEMPF